MSRLAATLGFVAASALVCGFVWLGAETIRQAPRGWRLDTARVAPTVEPVALGWRELGQGPGASMPNASRLLVRRLADGWWVANGSRDRGVILGLDDGSRRDIATHAVQAGDVVRLAGTEITVTEARPGHVAFQAADGSRVRWSRNRSGLDFGPAPALPACRLDGSPASETLRQDLRRGLGHLATLFGQDRAPEPVLTIGGGVNCPERWAAPALPPHAIAVFSTPDAMLIRLATGLDGLLVPAAGTAPVDLAAPWTNVTQARIRRLIIGGVSYDLAEDRTDLTLSPAGNRGLFDSPAPDRPGVTLEWQTSETAAWLGGGRTLEDLIAGTPRIPAMVAAGATLGLAAAALAWRRGWRQDRHRTGGAMAWGVYGTGLGTIVVSQCVLVGQAGLDLRAILALAAVTWLWTGLVLALTQSMRGVFAVFWIAATLLAGAGTLCQLSLGSGMPSERFVEAPGKVAVVWTLVAMAVATTAMVPPSRMTGLVCAVLGLRPDGMPLTASASRLLRWGLPALVIAALGVEAAMGWEAGLGVAQPSEAGKAVYVLGLAVMGAWHLHYARLNHGGVRWNTVMVRLGGGALVCLAIVGGLKAADDNSPILILALITVVWLVMVARAIRRAVGRRRYASRWMALPLGLAAIALTGGLAAAGWTVLADPCAEIDSKICRRIKINEDPLGHPDAYQLTTALAIAADAPLGADRLFRPNDIRARLLPEVESDMVVSFLFNRFGRLSVAGVGAAQLAYLLALVVIARQALRPSGPFESRLGQSFLGFAVGGFAATQALQWGLGYANALALAPITGQPFTFFSLGNSHLLAIVTPTLLLALVATRLSRQDAAGAVRAGAPGRRWPADG